MNMTHLEHTVIALVIQMALWWPLGLAASTAFAIAVFIGREIAQHEYKIAEMSGWFYGDDMNIKWWEGVVFGWSLDSALDVIIPSAVLLTVFFTVSQY